MNSAELNSHFLTMRSEIYGYILGYIKHREEAEDILQDLYVKVWKKRVMIRQETFRFYLFRSAKNLCFDVYRKKKQERNPEFSLHYAPSPEADLESRELTNNFREAVEKLQPNYREILYLRDVCLLEMHEIEKITGLTANNIRVTLNRARAKVKEQLTKIYKYESRTT